MPLSYFRRASFIGLCLYMAVLSAAYRFGFLGLHFSRSAKPPLAFSAGFEVLAETPSREGWGGWTFEGKILHSRLRGRVLARFPRNFPLMDVRPGEVVLVSGKLKIPASMRNPGDFDVRSFFSARGIFYELDAYSLRRISHLTSFRWLILSKAAAFQKSVQRVFGARFSAVNARLLSGMVLGLKGRLPRTLNREIQDAGVMHLLVPSGTKEVLVLAGIWFLGIVAALRPWPRFLIAALIGGFYAIAVGGEPPYLRALFAALFFEWGLRSGQDAVPFQALTLAAWAELLWNPLSLFSMGFQMSYAAAFGLILGFSRWEFQAGNKGKSYFRKMARMLGATLIVEAVLWPIFAVGFGRAPFLGALANLILFPLAGFFMFGGLFLWASEFLHVSFLSGVLMGALNGGLSFFCFVCRFFSRLPFSSVGLSHWDGISVLVYYLLILAFFLAPHWKSSLFLVFLAALIFASRAFIVQIHQPDLEAIYFSLDHGQAALIREKGNSPSLILANAHAGPLIKILRSEGVSKIRTLFLLPGSSFLDAGKLAAHLKILSIERKNADFQIVRGGAHFYFQPPGLQEGSRKFDIITPLRRHAVRAAIKARKITIDETF